MLFCALWLMHIHKTGDSVGFWSMQR